MNLLLVVLGWYIASAFTVVVMAAGHITVDEVQNDWLRRLVVVITVPVAILWYAVVGACGSLKQMVREISNVW